MVRFLIASGVLVGFGYCIGFRVQTNVLLSFAAVLLILLFGLCFCWIAVFIGMLVREPGAVQGVGFLLMFPITFGSSTFVPTATLPGWLQAWVHVNPFSHAVDAARGLMLGGPTAQPVLYTVAWAAGIVAVFMPLAIAAYKRKA